MQLSLGSSGETTKHLGTSLPIDWREDPSMLAAFLMTLFGGFIAGFGLAALHAVATGGRMSSSPASITIASVICLLIGLPIFLAGVNGFFLRTRIWIDPSRVHFKRTALIWGAADWTEPLSAFRGVLASQKYHPGGENSAPYTVYKIHLKHARDRDRDIELYRSRSGSAHRSETEGFATLLGLPVLTEQEDGSFAERDTADLDKTIRERAKEGRLDAPRFDPAMIPRDSGLKVTTTADGCVFEASMRRGLLGGLFFLVVGLSLVYWYFGPGLPDGEGPGWVVPLVGGVFALISLPVIQLARTRVERLEVSPDGVRIGQVAPGSALGSDAGDSMKAGEIEEVALKKDKYGRFRLTISGDVHSLTWGQYLSKSERLLVRDAIIATLAR